MIINSYLIQIIYSELITLFDYYLMKKTNLESIILIDYKLILIQLFIDYLLIIKINY